MLWMMPCCAAFQYIISKAWFGVIYIFFLRGVGHFRWQRELAFAELFGTACFSFREQQVSIQQESYKEPSSNRPRTFAHCTFRFGILASGLCPCSPSSARSDTQTLNWGLASFLPISRQVHNFGHLLSWEGRLLPWLQQDSRQTFAKQSPDINCNGISSIDSHDVQGPIIMGRTQVNVFRVSDGLLDLLAKMF